MENRTYRCDWRKAAGGGYKAWVIDAPSITSEAPDFDTCREVLAERITEERGDIDPLLEFGRGYPDSIIPTRYATPRYVWLGQNSAGELAVPIDTIFSSGYCAACRFPCGERTDRPIRLTSIPSGVDGLSIRRLQVAIYSKRLLDALGIHADADFDLGPVESEAKSRVELLEVRPRASDLILKSVAVKGFAVKPAAWHCSICGRRSIYYHTGVDLVEFVSAVQLSKRQNGTFLFGGRLCLPSAVWTRATRKVTFEDIYARQIGVAKTEDIDTSLVFDLVKPSLKTERKTAEQQKPA